MQTLSLILENLANVFLLDEVDICVGEKFDKNIFNYPVVTCTCYFQTHSKFALLKVGKVLSFHYIPLKDLIDIS